MKYKIFNRYLVKCPFCKKDMKVEVEGMPVHKNKKCVYCGRGFCLHRSPQDSNIVKDLGKRRGGWEF